jgi:hypothetical protein
MREMPVVVRCGLMFSNRNMPNSTLASTLAGGAAKTAGKRHDRDAHPECRILGIAVLEHAGPPRRGSQLLHTRIDEVLDGGEESRFGDGAGSGSAS